MSYININLGKFSVIIASNISLFLFFFSFCYSCCTYNTPFVVVLQFLDILGVLVVIGGSIFLFSVFPFWKLLLKYSQDRHSFSATSLLVRSPSKEFFVSTTVFFIFNISSQINLSEGTLPHLCNKMCM